ncbi:MAG: sensor histidine kinase [Acidobacteria bacterium]|nr:sensor histidine kinase [Acidobacteriota bacterium]
MNRKILQTAERLCLHESPQNPEAAQIEIVTIWKTAELMSKQFEVMEILANQRIAEHPPNSTIQPYRIFDKCVRVFNVLGQTDRFKIKAAPGFTAETRAYDKTFPIIATVLIGNAEKYSVEATEIRVYLKKDSATCTVDVTNLSKGQDPLTDEIFARGVRGRTEKDGSGNGLYVAQLVAHQHGTRISVKSAPYNAETMIHTFSVSFGLTQDTRRRLTPRSEIHNI